jgi:hypothetical protein
VPTNHTFLPWTRRGLAARASAVDTGPTATAPALPAQATITVGLTLSGIPEARYDLTLYGPGDVVGIDPRLIIRTDPRPGSANVEPNYLPLIEFDPPDFPWMFTPAVSGPSDRLRPWCVLIVVDLSVVAAPRVEEGRPLPVIEVPKAAAEVELPDLRESWAWAHTQLIAPPEGGSIPAALNDKPAMNLSRLLAPRRLEPGKRYAACLVPAFDAGVVRGLGGTPDAAMLAPAWPSTPSDPSAPNDPVTLPVYFHWEFTTGLTGDFEELARQLRPNVVAGSAGGERMHIGAVAPAISPADPSAYLMMDGALRPRGGSSGTLAEVPGPVRDYLRATLNAAAGQASSAPERSASALGPPIYGAWHAHQHTVADAGPPVWLRELNLDPRARAAAGLGGQIERDNQEQFMQWCWEQVERVLEANRLGSRARLSLDALDRVYIRHFITLAPDRLLQITAPLHSRASLPDGTVMAMIARSSVPNAIADPALRRLTSPQRPVLRAAIARADPSQVPGTSIPPMNLVGRLAIETVTSHTVGGVPVDPMNFIPHGLLGIPEMSTFSSVLHNLQDIDLTPIGLPISVPWWVVDRTWGSTQRAMADPYPQLAHSPLDGLVGEERLTSSRVQPGEGDYWYWLTGRMIAARANFPIRDPEPVQRLDGALARLMAGGLVVTGPPPRFEPLDIGAVSQSLLARTNPRVSVPDRLVTMLTVGGRTGLTDSPAGLTVAATLDRVMVAPEIDIPVYGYLASLDPRRFLPGVEDIPDSSITPLETNPRFVEALMVGLNDEMNRELLWRSFPTDQRGTPFRRFWDRDGGVADIAPIHEWPSANGLGANGPSGSSSQITLLIRGQLLRRFPTTAIYAWRARQGTLITPPGDGDIQSPVFSGVLGVDMVFVGFDLTDADLRRGEGWFFVLQEQPTEPRFGFDEFPGPGAPPALIPPSSWSDATWQHTATAPGHYLRIAGNPLTGRTLDTSKHLPGQPPMTATFVTHAAHLAAITIQKPMRVAFHAGGLPGGRHG